jgi:hypothetical protein
MPSLNTMPKRSMSLPVSLGPTAFFCALPDDVLRTLAAFVPPSGLLALVRCRLLQGQLTLRLDSLFVVTHIGITFVTTVIGYNFSLSKQWQHQKSKLVTLFGEADCLDSHRSYYFLEAPKGYDWFPPLRGLYLRNCSYSGRYFGAQYQSRFQLHKFKTWLQRRAGRRAELPIGDSPDSDGQGGMPFTPTPPQRCLRVTEVDVPPVLRLLATRVHHCHRDQQWIPSFKLLRKLPL